MGGARSTEGAEMMGEASAPLQGSGLGQGRSGAGVVPKPPSGPRKDHDREAVLTPEDLLHPDMMCLTKAGGKERNQPLHLSLWALSCPFGP